MMGCPFKLGPTNSAEIHGEEKRIQTKCKLSARFQSAQKKNETHKKHVDSRIGNHFLIARIMDGCSPLEQMGKVMEYGLYVCVKNFWPFK